uniref:UTP14C small subunit processome component n=1 Tax=Pygocentrus nattereri TaxID=42514 RepID=A0AAR2IKC6_PYGNA
MAGGGNNEEELSPDDEHIISASEEEDGSDDESKHAKLLEAISSLGKRKRMKRTERSEASVQVSEFSVNADGTGEKVNLSDLLGTMDKTPGAPNKTKQQLKNLQNRKETLELPLSKQQTEKQIQREVAYDKSSKEVSRWETVITQNQKAEQLVFPLRQDPTGPKRMEQVVAGWKAKTPLEKEIFSLLHSNNQPIHDPLLTPAEEASIKAMSLEEAKIRQAEFRKARVLQSYYEAKARRERKIKSKKYHKLQKKAKVKAFLKQFDEMMKTDPAGALEELKKMELSRMQERMSLKHQNSGKWAKSKAIMAKYDDAARKAMQEQLEMNKQLTQKLVVPSDDDDDEERNVEEADALPDFVNDPEPILDSVNPWMRGKLTQEHSEPEVTAVATETAVETKDEGQNGQREDEEEEENEEEKLLREFERKRKLRQDEDDDLVPVPQEEKQGERFSLCFTKPRHFLAIFKAELLDEGLVRVRTMDDLEALQQDVVMDTTQPAPASATPAPSMETTSEPPKKKKKKKGIDPNEVLTKEAKVIKMPLAPTVVEEEEEEVHAEQTAIIKEAFAGDDVISDFLKDKRKQEKAGQAEVVDLTLPGWGEWGGVGLKPSKRKRRKFRLKAPAPPLRKDQNLPDVIISEKRNSSVANHQVSQLPFPFQNSTQFESCVRFPVGQTWNTQTTFRKLTAPKVVTKMGAIIEPMSKEDLPPVKESSGAGKREKTSIGWRF